MITPSHRYVIIKNSRVEVEVECDIVVIATRVVVEDLPVHYLVGARAREGYVNDRCRRPYLKSRMTSDVVGPESKACSTAKDSSASPLASSALEPQYVDLVLESPATRRVSSSLFPWRIAWSRPFRNHIKVSKRSTAEFPLEVQ